MQRYGKRRSKSKKDEAPDWAEPEATTEDGASMPENSLASIIRDLNLVSLTDAGQEKTGKRDEQQEAKRERRIRAEALLSARFGKSTIRRALEYNPPAAVTEWAHNYKSSWQVYSGGMGKTIAAAYALSEVAYTLENANANDPAGPDHSLRYALYITATDLCGMYKRASMYGEDNKEESINRYAYSRLLVLDCLGRERIDSQAFEALAHVIEYREDYQKPTIITVDTSVNECFHRYDRIAKPARIKELLERVREGLCGWKSDPEERAATMARNVIKFN